MQDISVTAAPTPSAFSGRARRVILALLFGVHLVATFFFFPLRELANDRPVITLDHSFHYYQALRASKEFPRTWRLHYYDPYYMAGYPTAIFDLDVKAAELFCAPFSGSGVARAFKLFILLCYLTLFFTVYKACRLCGLRFEEAVMALIVCLVFWHWGRPYASHFRYAGMFEFILVSHVSLLVVALFHSFLSERHAWPFFILGPLAFLFHPTAVVILPVPFLLLIVLERRWLTISRSLLFALWCAVVIAVNAIWIIPLLQYAETKSASNAFFQIAGLGALLDVVLKPGSLPALFLIAAASIGSGRLLRSRRAVELCAFLSTAVFLTAVAAFGVYTPGLEHLEPGRFLLTALLFLTPAAGVGLYWIWESFFSAVRGARARAAATFALAALAASPVLLSLLSARTGYRHRLFTSPTPEVARLIEELSSRTSVEGRLMIEDGPAYLYGESHIPGLLAGITGVEQIGGPYPFTFVRHHFTTFQADKTMGRPLREIAHQAMRDYIDLYNVLWIVTATAEGREYVDRLAGSAAAGGEGTYAERLWEAGRYSLWRVNRRAAFASDPLSGVRAGYDRIEVEVADGVEELLIKYHWDKGLRVEPPAEITPLHQLDDPVPFILLEPNGRRRVLITY